LFTLETLNDTLVKAQGVPQKRVERCLFIYSRNKQSGLYKCKRR